MLKYEPSKIEPKWQKLWQESDQNRIDLSDSKKKYYLLVEFTYPSGDLHMGHWFAFAVPDIFSRLKRMQGYTVFAPNGFDAFGLPAENAAISRGVHPSDWTYGNIKRMKQQFGTMGAIYDWGHEVITCDPEYYRWNQWIFLKMFERGLAYRAKATSNWCPKDQCVLANENVENGKCWRCGSEVVQKEVEQWFLKITDYAERLLWKDEKTTDYGLQTTAGSKSAKAVDSRQKTVDGSIDWPKSLREGQNNWIGKSEGTIIKFPVTRDQSLGKGEPKDSRLATEDYIEVFTTRADTLFGATFLVLAPEHPFVASLLDTKHETRNTKLAEIREYIKRSRKKSELERKEMREKTGVFTGVYAISPVNGREIPIWVADYALMGYGTGALFGDAHDERDVEFAKKYGIALKPTLVTGDRQRDERIKSLEEVFGGDGILFDSGEFSGLASARARVKITDWLAKNGKGRAEVVYHLHDWSISRQRYWGTPIPVIYCGNCWEVKSQKLKVKSVEGRDFAIIDGKKHAINPVPLDQLPVELPYEVDFAPKGKPPLATAGEWVRVKCPNCGSEARREVETMDTFVDSSWYFLAYLRDINSKSEAPNPKQIPNSKFQISNKFENRKINGKWKVESGKFDELPWDLQFVRGWMPVDIYFGGAEHTLGHTLYSRFFVKFLQDIGVIPVMPEYARKRVHHGVILGPDGQRMSKSHGNVVNPDDEVKQYGADAVRLYLAFLGPYDLVAPWDPGGIRGVYHFLQRVWKLAEIVAGPATSFPPASAPLTSFEVNSAKNIEKFTSSDNEKRAVGIPSTGVTRNDLGDEDLHWMHKTIKKVGEDIEVTKFNTAVAALMEWLNYLSAKAHKVQETQSQRAKGDKDSISSGSSVTSVTSEEYQTFLKLLAPFAPHICEELWQVLQSQKSKVKSQKFDSIHQQLWPEYDRELAEAKQVTLVVQVDGKVRDKLLIRAGMAQNEAEKLALVSAKVQKYLEGKSPRKVIFVQDRLINFVV